MIRATSVICRKNLLRNVFDNFRENVVLNCNRRSSTAVSDANERAKLEAKKNLDAVTSVIGRLDGWEEPEFDEHFIKKWVAFFDRPEIDSWEIRRGIHELTDFDTIPDPEIVCAGLRACRRLNDYALAIRLLEMTKCKCGHRLNKYYPYILQEIRPTLDELGIETPEELGYDKPELAVMDVDDIH